MKNLVLCMALAATVSPALAQEKLTRSDVSEHTYTFEIVDGNLTGRGADVLKQKIAQSQFVMLGEEHYSPQISELTNALLPVMAQSDFKYFAVETGPHSANKLVSEITDHGSLFDFNSSFIWKYKYKPIPFFDEKEAETYLKTAIGQGFEMWGLDQEFLSSQLFLIDDIYELSADKATSHEEYLQAKQYLEEQFSTFINKDIPVFKDLLSSPVLDNFFRKATSEKQQQIINDLLSSWEIYAGRGHAGNLLRKDYMKKRFADEYRKASIHHPDPELHPDPKVHPAPKVFIKMGSNHLGYGKNWLGIYDLGNMVYELAQFNGTKSVSITCFPRYTLNEDHTLEDSMNTEEGATYSPILDFAEKDKWFIVDTSPIKEIVMNRSVQLHEDLEMLVFHYDFIIFTPTKTKVTPNY